MPYRVAGDKNFLLNLSESLNIKGFKTKFISIAEPPDIDLVSIKNFCFIPRPFHNRKKNFYHKDQIGKIIGYHHKHGSLREFFELASTLLFYRSKLRGILRKHPRVIIHWTDLSVAMPIVRLVFGRKPHYVCSMLRYVSKGRIGNIVRSLAVNVANTIITSNNAGKKLLVKNGCKNSRIAIAPWGTADPMTDPIKCIRQERRINSGRVKLLWAGFIQQIGEPDFFRTVNLAKSVIDHRSNRQSIQFTFCLKPELFKERYLSLQSPNILIKKGDEAFIDELAEYDALLSPVLRTDSSMAPPLTWIEALAVGLPIITTRTLGIDDLLTDGKSALIFYNYDEIEDWLSKEKEIFSKLQNLRKSTRAEFLSRYSMDIVGEKYLKIYRRTLDG